MKTTDIDLIQRVLDGDEAAFTALVKKYQKRVHTLVWRKIGDFHIAEEITQDVFLKAYKKLPMLKPPYHFSGWLYVIATRRCIAWMRKRQKSTTSTSLDAMPAAQLEEVSYAQYENARAEAADVDHQRDLVKRLLRKLPESEHTVVTLHYIAEMSCEKISEFLGVSPNTVKSRLHRARKRLETQEHLLHDVSAVFRLSPNLTENIMREVAHIEPTTAAASRPWVPWGLSFASACLIILMMGFGPRPLSHFQQPYNLDATSEMTVELVEAPVVLPLKLKSDPRTQLGRSDRLGKNSGTEFRAGSFFLAAAQADETDVPITKPQWVQTKGPGGVSRAGLFLASDRALYAIAKTGLYRLTEKADAWTFVSSAGPNREFSLVMAERGKTLYTLTSDALLASTDYGKTWEDLGNRPEGRAIALFVTDASPERSSQRVDRIMYLVLRTEVFRSEDGGKRWQPIGEVLQSDIAPEAGDPEFRIWDALAIDDILFVGTSHGLFRFAGNWKKLSVPTPQGIKSLAVSEDRLYVGTIVGPRQRTGWGPHAAVFFSTDLGDSWTDITPNTHAYPVKLIATVEVVPVGNKLMLAGSGGVLLSYDGGETWMDPVRDLDTSGTFPGAFPVVALDEHNFYKTYHAGIVRSTDGGITWHPFMTGLVSADVQNLIAVRNVLYAVTGNEIVSSVDGGESWKTLNVSGGGKLLLPRIKTTDETLYVSSIADNRTQLFHLPVKGEILALVHGIPDFDEDNLYVEWKKRLREARETNVNVRETEKLWRERLPLIAKEDITNGGFTLAGETIFMEHRRKLFRWRSGETAWHYTGLEDDGELSPIDGKGLTLAISENVIYVGKRARNLFRSLDNGDTWKDITKNLAFPFVDFKGIVFAGSTVYISTDVGVMYSRDGENWHVLTDADENRIIMDRIAVRGTTAYGVCGSGVYKINTRTNTWEQVSPEVPYTATAFVVDSNAFYIGTKHSGVLRFQLNNNW